MALQMLQEGLALHETFLANLWDLRHVVFPVRMPTLQGLLAMHALGISPDLIYIDADHTQEAVLADLEASAALFPNALLVGDDWQWLAVRAAVVGFAERFGDRAHLHSHPRENWWWIERVPSRADCQFSQADGSKRARIDFVPSAQM